METKYPTLRRPKRKLCYLTNKETPSNEWAGTLTLADIDRMFDDMDPSSHDEDDLLPQSPPLKTSEDETNQSEREASQVPQQGHPTENPPKCQMGPEGDVLHPATKSPSPKLDIDLDIPFKAHGPVKTSSPIEENMVVEGLGELNNEKDQVVSPIIFASEDEGKGEAVTEDPIPSQKPQCEEHITEDDDIELESPPSNFALGQPRRPSPKNKVKGTCQENKALPLSAVTQEPELAVYKKKSESAHRKPPVATSSRVAKDTAAFLEKLRNAGQSKPAWKSLSPVKVATPPEPEDDFLILEDDTPLWISIPRTTATSKRQKQSRTFSTDKGSSADNGTKDSPLETAQKQQESKQDNRELESQKRKTMKEKKNEMTEPGNDKELSSPEDLLAGDLMERKKPNKKKERLKKVPSKESCEAQEHPKDTVVRETDEENPTLKTERKAQKSSDMKTPKSLKDGNENAKTSRAKSLKRARKVTQGSDAVKEPVCVEAVKKRSLSSEEHAEAEDLGCLSDKERIYSETQTAKDVTGGKDKQNKLPVTSEGSSSEDDHVLGKRKRRQTGQWWLSFPQSAEFTDESPTLKKSKQNNKEPGAAVPPAVKATKNRVLKKRQSTQTAPSSSRSTNKAKDKKTKWNKNRNARGDAADEIRATDGVCNATDAEQVEEQEQHQEVLDQDPDLVQSSPLDLTHRDHGLNSGDQVFQRVYHHVSNETKAVPPLVSPRRPREQLRAAETEKRRRKPPSNWWRVDGMSEDVESISSQPRHQEPKPRKERKKQPKRSKCFAPGTPKNSSPAASSTPLGGAPVPPLKVKPLSAPKTFKRSVATFKDIFTSVPEIPTVVRSREAGQNTGRKVTARLAEEVTAANCTNLGNKEILSTDADESEGPTNLETPQDSMFQSDNMLKSLRSGPFSMIELEQYEENEDSILPSTRCNTVLSVSDLCAPPLKPLVLQPKDNANLKEWFKSLWSATVDGDSAVTPDQFDWYFFQGRAIGFLVDQNCGSFCNGKVLLGSYMKKPLWVDHSATTVFNLLTSSVSVSVNGSKSRFNPGQSFVVTCGHAYSIQNVNAQPAVLYFTRIAADSSD